MKSNRSSRQTHHLERRNTDAAALLFVIFVVLLVIAIPVSITLGIASVLPSVFDPSFTVGAKYLTRAMFGGLDSFPLLAVPMFVLPHHHGKGRYFQEAV